MKRLAASLTATVLLLAAAVLVYGGKGYVDALSDADGLAGRADALISGGRGGGDLGGEHLRQLLMVQDPGFRQHAGVDLTTAGAGITTVTQSLAKRVAFDAFRPGIAKIRQTGYAMGLEQRLTKDQILALWLDTLEMGKGPDGWMTGFFAASETVHGKLPADLDEREFLALVAVLIAPARYSLLDRDPGLEERVARIERLVHARCAPIDNGDVWLEGCRSR